jgi:hypothetical protein
LTRMFCAVTRGAAALARNVTTAAIPAGCKPHGVSRYGIRPMRRSRSYGEAHW